jgi:hypothetical protein
MIDSISVSLNSPRHGGIAGERSKTAPPKLMMLLK